MRDDQHPIAGVDPLGKPPQFPDRRTAAARLTLILDVVVDEREVVDKLDAGGDRQRSLGDAAGGAASQQA